MRGGLWSSFAVPSAGIRTRNAPRFESLQVVIAWLGVANVLPQNRPNLRLLICWKCQRRIEVWHCSRHETAVVAPGEREIWRELLPLLELVLRLGCLLECPGRGRFETRRQADRN